CGSRLLPPEVGIGAVEPVLSNRAEDVDVERVLERDGAMRYVRRYDDDFTGPEHQLFAADREAERAVDDIADLLRDVGMLGHDGVLLEMDLRDHFVSARNPLARDLVGDGFPLHVVPGM